VANAAGSAIRGPVEHPTRALLPLRAIYARLAAADCQSTWASNVVGTFTEAEPAQQRAARSLQRRRPLRRGRRDDETINPAVQSRVVDLLDRRHRLELLSITDLDGDDR
jgi:hypothetical protein